MADAMLSKKQESEDSRNKNRQQSQQTGKNESAKKKCREATFFSYNKSSVEDCARGS
jgi:hypothetical protein